MWSSRQPRRALGRRRCLLLAASFALSGSLAACGFRPLYSGARGEAAAADLAAIEVRAPLNRLGRILENQLTNDLNPAGLTVPKRYRLDVTLERNKRALAIQLDDTTTRFDLTLVAFFTLRPLDGGEASGPAAATADAAAETESGIEGNGDDAASPPPLYRSGVRRVASYNVINEPFATLVAEQDADRRAAVEVSRAIRTLLTLHFENGTA
jgi:LPS-assembly lipoprotein